MALAHDVIVVERDRRELRTRPAARREHGLPRRRLDGEDVGAG